MRSAPYSRYSPQFNRESLGNALKQDGIKYVILGRELGARSDDPSCYEDGRVQYARLARADLFRSGIERVERGSKHHRVALMCAEKDPMECHRAILVAPALLQGGMSVQHILWDGRIEDHEALVERLLVSLGLGQNNTFPELRGEIVEQALRLQEHRIAYVADRSGRGKGQHHEHCYDRLHEEAR